MNKIVIIIAFFLFSCTEEITNYDINIFSANDVYIEILENELLVQVEIEHSEGLDQIDSVWIILNYETVDSTYTDTLAMNDDGINGDLIPNNGIYSSITIAEEISTIVPAFISIDIPESFQLHATETDTLEVNLEIIGNELTFDVEIFALDTQFNLLNASENISTNQLKVDIDVKRTLMYLDDPDDDVCNREWVEENEYKDLILLSEGVLNPDGTKSFMTSIPFTSVADCGGTGIAEFRFELIDFTGSIFNFDHVLIIDGCGDGECTGYETSQECSEDCP